MTLADLIADFRTDSGDNLATLLTSDATAIRWYNEAQDEGALRKNLLFDDYTTAVCDIAVTTPTGRYPLHPSIFAVTRATFLTTGVTDDPTELFITDRVERDRIRTGGWRYLTEEQRAVIVDDTTIRFAGLPDTSGNLHLEVYRGALVPMALAVTGPPAVAAVDPEIARPHHRFLTQWVLHRHFGQPDAEIHDPKRAETALAAFTAYFGERPDADMRRNHWANMPAHNKVAFP